MTRKRRRLYFVGLGLLALFAGSALMLSAVSDNVTFFVSPSDLKTRAASTSQRLRLGGLVEDGSVQKNGSTVTFVVTDTAERVNVSYTGILPDLFREGQGIVAEGTLAPGGIFMADDVLAKHDENYMPREVADALKASGHWQEGVEGENGVAADTSKTATTETP